MPAIPQFFPGLPDLPALLELRQHRQWVSWRYEQRDGGKPTKPPVNPHTGKGASHSDPRQWGTYDDALSRTWRNNLPGVGFVLAPNDEFSGGDLDDCLDREGRIEPWARTIVDLAETYVEVSPSGTGLRLFMRGKPEKTVKSDPAHVELYRDRRFLTVTGRHLAGTPETINPAPETVRALLARAAEFRPVEPPVRSNIQGGQFFRVVNDAALQRLGAWVPALFGSAARFQQGTGGYRVSSKALGRKLQEDLSITPQGIKDWGVADMGDPRGGGRTAIDLVLEYGPSTEAKPAALWLCDRIGLNPDKFDTPDPVAAESQRNLAAKVRVKDSDGPPEPDEDNATPRRPHIDASDLSDLRFPSDAFTPEALGGLLGDMADHIMRTSMFPVAEFAIGGALTIGAGLYGRRWAEPIRGGGLNVYFIAPALSGWGKDHPIQEAQRLAYKCGMMRWLTAEEHASDASIEKDLRRFPVRIAFTDEFGLVLQANNSKNSGPWERRIRKLFLQLYSKSSGIWTGRQSAGDQIEKGTDVVHRPTLSLYGTSTPEELYKGLTEDNIRDGLFGRLIFISPDRRPDRAAPQGADYDFLQKRVAEVLEYVPAEIPGVGPINPQLYASNRWSPAMEPTVYRVPASGEAEAAIGIILDWQRDIVEDESGISRIANRAAENTGKLATLRALSRSHVSPMVELDDVRWAWSVIERSLAIITRDIEAHMAGSDIEVLAKTIRRNLKEAGKNGLKLAELFRRHGISKFHPRDRSATIDEMVKYGEVEIERTNRGHRIRLKAGASI